MPLRVTIDALGENVIDRTMLGVAGRLEDMRPVWNEIDAQLSRVSVRRFASQGTYGSGGWAPLAESTRWAATSLGAASSSFPGPRAAT